LFRELAQAARDNGIDVLGNPLQAVNHPKWAAIFDRVFHRDVLIAAFGEIVC
jgi:beta-glucosidase-like glycosyl hydrolase